MKRVKHPRGPTPIEHVRIDVERFELIPSDGNVYHIVYVDKQIPPCHVDIVNINGTVRHRLPWGTRVNVTINLNLEYQCPDAISQ